MADANNRSSGGGGGQDGAWVVSHIQRGSLAARSAPGLIPGFVLWSINGVPLSDASSYAAADRWIVEAELEADGRSDSFPLTLRFVGSPGLIQESLEGSGREMVTLGAFPYNP